MHPSSEFLECLFFDHPYHRWAKGWGIEYQDHQAENHLFWLLVHPIYTVLKCISKICTYQILDFV